MVDNSNTDNPPLEQHVVQPNKGNKLWVPALTMADQTRRTWEILTNPPDGSSTPLEASRLCLQDTDDCRKKTANRINNKDFFARNNNWNPRPLPNIQMPIAWPFVQATLLTKDASGNDILGLDFVAAPPAGYNVKIFGATYGDAHQAPPHFIAVAYPMDLDISEPPPFLVHFKHYPGQDPTSSLFVYFEPMGFDWLFYEIWSWLTYNARETATNHYIVDMPFLSVMQSSFGLCYQLRQAKKPYVIVLPQVSRVFEGNGNRLENYQFYSAEVMHDVLLAVQNTILSLPADKQQTLGPVAISANSSGCNVLSGFLGENLAKMKSNPTVEDFMRERLQEIFILDPPEDFGENTIKALSGWRGLVSSIDPGKKKCVRFYSHSFLQGFAELAGGSNPFKLNVAGFWEDGGKTTSLTYLPFLPQGNDIWQRTHDNYIHNADKVSNFRFVHHAIPALFFTDATRRSLYV